MVKRRAVISVILMSVFIYLVAAEGSALADESSYEAWLDAGSSMPYGDVADVITTEGVVFEGTISGALNGTARWGMNSLKFVNPMMFSFYSGWGVSWGPSVFEVNGARIEGHYIQYSRETLPLVYLTGYFYGGVEGVYQGVFDYTTYTANMTGELTRTDTTGPSPQQVSGDIAIFCQAVQPGKETSYPSTWIGLYNPHVLLPTGTISGFFNSTNNQAIGQAVSIYDVTNPHNGTVVAFGNYSFTEAVLGPLTGSIAGGEVQSFGLPAEGTPGTYSSVHMGNEAQEAGNIGIILGDWFEDPPGLGYSNHFLGTGYHANTGPDFFLLSPLEGENLRTMPTFSWSAGGNNLFSVEFSYSPTFATVLWATYTGGVGAITQPYWTIPESLWAKLPNQQTIYWRVRGTDTGVYPYVIETTDIRSFTKGGIALALVREAEKQLAAEPIPDSFTVGEPAITGGGGGNVYMVWSEHPLLTEFPPTFGHRDIYFRRSTDSGATWQTKSRLDTDPLGAAESYDPQIISDDGGRIYVVWRDYRNGNSDIYFNYSADYGVTWQASDIRLDTDTAGAAYAWYPQISCDASGHVYVVWHDDRDANSDIYLNRSTDYGATWLASDVRIDRDVPASGYSYGPLISSDESGHVYVVWYDFRNGNSDIYFNYSSDYGATWQSSDIRLDKDYPGTSQSEYPQISSDQSGRVYVVWTDYRNNGAVPDIYFNYSSDHGATWQAYDIRLDTDAPGAAASGSPQICSDDNGHVYVVWADLRNDEWPEIDPPMVDIYFNSSNDHGVTWQLADSRIDTDAPGATISSGPRIGCDESGHVHVAWTEYAAGAIDPCESEDICFNHSVDYGATWQSKQVRLETDALGASTSFSPQICNDQNGTVYVAWEYGGCPWAISGCREIRFVRAIQDMGGNVYSPPIFDWSPSSCLEVYSVDFANNEAFSPVLWRSYEDGGVNLAESYWAMPLSIWKQVPANQTLYWRVRGAESDDLSHILTSDEAWPFVKPTP